MVLPFALKFVNVELKTAFWAFTTNLSSLMKENNMTQTKKCNLKELLYCFALAVSFLFICSKNSLLYPMNDWVDVDCIFTVGKTLKHGAVLYRDVFDHKGPVLYFLYSIAAFISENTYIGLWLLEIISITGFFFLSMKCVRLSNSVAIVS